MATRSRWKAFLQVGFIVNDQRVLPQESRVGGFRFEAGAIAGEQQPAADHVHRADDHRRPCRIVPPFGIVRELPPQGTDGKRQILLSIGGKDRLTR